MPSSFNYKPSLSGGSTQISSALNITLSAASNRIQSVAMTTANKSVTMPSATALTTGGQLFVIKNAGTSTFAVRNSTGVLLTALVPTQIAAFYLADNTSPAGVWAVGNESASSFLGAIFGPIITLNAIAGSTDHSVTALSGTQAIIAWRGTSNYLETCVLNVNGTTLSTGPILVAVSAAVTRISITGLSTTQAIVTYRDSATNASTLTLNVSGNTITGGAVLQFSGAVISDAATSVTKLSSTQAIVVYLLSSNSYVQSCTLNISGTTVTAGAILAVNAVSSDYPDITGISSTQALAAWQGTSSYIQLCTLNVSATTVTAGAILVVNAVASYYPALAGLSTTSAVLACSQSPLNLNVYALTISGTTVTAGTALTSLTSLQFARIGFAATSSTQATLVWVGKYNLLNTCNVTVSGATATAGTVSVISTPTTASPMVEFPEITALVNSSQLITSFYGGSGYLQACTLEGIQT